MKDTQFYTVQGWMVNRLKLSKLELVAFAVIYGFSQHGEGEYKGSASFLCSCYGCTRPTAAKALESLEEKGLTLKRQEVTSKGKTNRYVAHPSVIKWANTGFANDVTFVKNLYKGVCKDSLQGAGKNLYIGSKDSLQRGVKNLYTVSNSNKEEIKKVGKAEKSATDLDQFSIENETADNIARFVEMKMRRELKNIIPDGRYLPEVAKEIGRSAAGDGFKFTPGHKGHEKGLVTWATSYVSQMPSGPSEKVDEPKEKSFNKKPAAYDRIIGMYQNITGRLTNDSQRKYLAPVIREYITKPGITDSELKTAFNQLRRAGQVFDELDYTLKNIPKLLTQAQNAAA